ncbi:helix-turn-helix domain-containing protein [Thermoactinomyces mirandus]|uniref:Helix-turn-helix domain-containing protein n=1 Tax=Thermoactinomyces mirandus TaxID=2756294 RepID=A0A7W2ASK1_9BACL|nr:helix-turn-helix domain-containing protein [Thermoactinomyces mirandus]MBA4603517.1 helix-turn-helix domain-containing protein [Thermoactinomyces mirandus]
MFAGVNECIARYIIRRTRKEKGLRQEDAADKTISYGTISNIERGSKKVDEETVRKYLRKLGLTETRVINLARQEEEEIEFLMTQLDAIESMLNHNKAEKPIQLLKAIGIERYHPLAPYYTYLEGRCFQLKRKWKKAEKHYKFAIRLRNQYNLPLKGNIASKCYNELGICFFLQNHMEKALSYIEKGLNAYNDKEDGEQIIFALNSNKVFYLMNSGQYENAKQVLNELWSAIPEIENKNTALTCIDTTH